MFLSSRCVNTSSGEMWSRTASGLNRIGTVCRRRSESICWFVTEQLLVLQLSSSLLFSQLLLLFCLFHPFTLLPPLLSIISAVSFLFHSCFLSYFLPFILVFCLRLLPFLLHFLSCPLSFPFLSFSISSFLISCLTFFLFTSFSSSPLLFPSFIFLSFFLCTASISSPLSFPSFSSLHFLPSPISSCPTSFPLYSFLILSVFPNSFLSSSLLVFSLSLSAFQNIIPPYSPSSLLITIHPSSFLTFFPPPSSPSFSLSPLLPLSPLSLLLSPPDTLPNLVFSHLPLFSCLPLLISVISFSPVFLSPLPPSLSTVPETSRALPSFPLRDRPKRQHGEEHPQQLPRHAHAHDKVQPEGSGRSSGEPQNRVHVYQITRFREEVIFNRS